MADYIVSGQRGAGKSLVMVGRIRSALLKGRRVATNLDINLVALMPYDDRYSRVIRLPDRPSGDDMVALGIGSDSVRESTFGDIILDELAIWLNARDWQNSKRQGLLDYLVLSRKYRWNTFLLTQVLTSLDKQARSLLEHHVRCFRSDRMRIPVIGWIIKLLGSIIGIKAGFMPQVHIGLVTYGTGPGATFSDRWVYRGLHLYDAYNTEQKFLDSYPHGSYSYLPNWYFIDRTFKVGMPPPGDLRSYGYCRSVQGDYGYSELSSFNFDWPGRPEFWSKAMPTAISPAYANAERSLRGGAAYAC